MRILVTGGRGSVGAPLVEELRGRGHDVFPCDLVHGSEQFGFSVRSDSPDARYVRCDVSSYRQIERVFDRLGPFDYVYHAAAEFGRWNGEDYYEALWTTNAIGTKNIIRLQESLGFRLIHFSSSEVYGDWPDIMVETVLDEYAIRQMNDYAMSKWVNEQQVHNSIEQYDTETVVIRLFNLYGPGEYYSPYRSVNCRFIHCALRGWPFVVYKGHERTSTYLGDAVRTIANIVDNFVPGEVYNIGGSEIHSIETLAELVLDVTGADQDLVTYERSEILTTKRKEVDVSKSIRDLDHEETVDLREGLKRTANWMKDVYRLSG